MKRWRCSRRSSCDGEARALAATRRRRARATKAHVRALRGRCPHGEHSGRPILGKIEPAASLPPEDRGLSLIVRAGGIRSRPRLHAGITCLGSRPIFTAASSTGAGDSRGDRTSRVESFTPISSEDSPGRTASYERLRHDRRVKCARERGVCGRGQRVRGARRDVCFSLHRVAP